MTTSVPRVDVNDYVKNTKMPTCPKCVIDLVEERRYYLAHKMEYSDEGKAEIERLIAAGISRQLVCGVEEYLLDYQGYPLSVITAYDGVSCVCLGGKDRVVVCLDGLEEGEFLNRIDDELNGLIDDAIFQTKMFWFCLALDVPDIKSPGAVQSDQVGDFKEKTAEADVELLAMLDDADRVARDEPGKTAGLLMDCLSHFGYYVIGSDIDYGRSVWLVQSGADSDLLEFGQYDPEIGLKMAAVYMGTLLAHAKLVSGALAEFFDTGAGTVSLEGK